MKKENNNYLKQLIYTVVLFLIICTASICVDNEPVQARYSSAKQVRKAIRKLNKKIKKVKAKSKKAYAKWINISSGRSIGTADSKYMDRVSVRRGNPLIIQSGNTYYYLKGRSSRYSYFSGNIRLTGGYTTIDGMTCANAQVVSGPKSYAAANKASRKYKKYERQLEDLEYDRSQLRKILRFKVKTKKRTTYVGRKVKLRPANTCGNKITWKSSNKKIATVTKKGVVTGKSPGKVVITAKTNLSKKKSKITVNVKKISTLELECRGFERLKNYPYMSVGEVIELADNQEEITSVHSSNEKVVSRVKDGDFGEICLQGMSVGKAVVTIYSKNAQVSLEIVVFKPHITFEKTEYNFDASALGTDVTLNFKSNIPVFEKEDKCVRLHFQSYGDGSVFSDYDVIYDKKQGDGLDVEGRVILHLTHFDTDRIYLCVDSDSSYIGEVPYYFDESQIIKISVKGERHITFEQVEYNFDASSLGTDVAINFKSNIPLEEEDGGERNEIVFERVVEDVDKDEDDPVFSKYDIIYDEKQEDKMNVHGKVILHLSEVGTEEFYLYSSYGYLAKYTSQTIKVSVAGPRLSYETDSSERHFLDNELTIDNSYNNWGNSEILTLHGATVHKAVSSDEDILAVNVNWWNSKGIVLEPREEKHGTVTVTIYTEETGEKIELTVHVCRLNIKAEANSFEWRNAPITSYFEIDFLSGSPGINEVKGEVIGDEGENLEEYFEFGEYKDGKLYFTIKRMQNFWEDEYTVRISVNGFTREETICVNYDENLL